MSKKAAFFHITGFVQGVFFRAHTKEKANELGLTGWVRNCNDGSVEVFAQGKLEALDALETWCKEGPPTAQVEKVLRSESQGDPELKSFEVHY